MWSEGFGLFCKNPEEMTELGDVERQRCTEFMIACGKYDKASRSARASLGRARAGKSLIMYLLALLLFGVHGLHPRSKHLGRYDIGRLVEVNPALRPLTFVSEKTGDQTVDWGNRDAVFQLNKALLMQYYGVSNAYDVPSGWLVPPVPSRADLVHVIADLIFEEGCTDPASSVVGLDIGTGANAIFPLIASAEFGWKMVGTETNIQALAIARKNALATSHSSLIALRHQPNPLHFFKNVVADGERFNFCICNPPFYSSKAEAQAASDRKTHNLGLARGRGNFEGQGAELWCRGGEAAFISGMIDESATREFRGRLGWLASLVSNRRNLRPLQDLLVSRKPSKSVVREISTGNKMATVLAWRFD